MTHKTQKEQRKILRNMIARHQQQKIVLTEFKMFQTCTAMQKATIHYGVTLAEKDGYKYGSRKGRKLKRVAAKEDNRKGMKQPQTCRRALDAALVSLPPRYVMKQQRRGPTVFVAVYSLHFEIQTQTCMLN